MSTSSAKGAKRPFRIEAATRGAIATVIVGPESTKYHIHKAVLMEHSEYFKKALEGPWKEAEEGVVRMDDIESETFSYFVDWIYTQQDRPSKGSWHMLNAEESAASQKLRLQACILGDRLLAPGFVKAVRNRLAYRLVHSEPVYLETIKFAFDNFAATDTLLKLMVDLYCQDYATNISTTSSLKLHDLPKSFLVAAVQRYTTHGGLDVELQACDYHIHSSEQETEECKWLTSRELECD